jgi:transposase-like protein
MSQPNGSPETLMEAIRHFADPDVSLAFAASAKWPTGPDCPRCGQAEPSFLTTRRLWKCRGCKKQFSVKVGTIFEDSPVPLDKWMAAVWMIVNAKNGVSSYELARSIGVTQPSAWFMAHRIRLALQGDPTLTLGGEVEVDETFIGGKARFMHKGERARKIKGTGGMGKAAVMGLLERHGPDGHSRVKAKVVPNVRRSTLAPEVRQHVESGADVFTDALKSYADLGTDYRHQVIDHAEAYVRGNVHTNGLENFWSLVKRCVKGTYVSIEPFHLFRYLDEEVFRFNHRKETDASRFVRALRGIVGKRLTYEHLIGDPATTPA